MHARSGHFVDRSHGQGRAPSQLETLLLCCGRGLAPAYCSFEEVAHPLLPAHGLVLRKATALWASDGQATKNKQKMAGPAMLPQNPHPSNCLN